MPPTTRTAEPLARLQLSAYAYEVHKTDQLVEDDGTRLEVRKVAATEQGATFTFADGSTREYGAKPWPILEIWRDRSLVPGHEDDDPINADELPGHSA